MIYHLPFHEEEISLVKKKISHGAFFIATKKSSFPPSRLEARVDQAGPSLCSLPARPPVREHAPVIVVVSAPRHARRARSPPPAPPCHTVSFPSSLPSSVHLYTETFFSFLRVLLLGPACQRPKKELCQKYLRLYVSTIILLFSSSLLFLFFFVFFRRRFLLGSPAGAWLAGRGVGLAGRGRL